MGTLDIFNWGGVGDTWVFRRLVLHYECCSLFLFMHVSLHFCVVAFMIAHLRILSVVFSHVWVLGSSYTCVVVSCLGNCVCDAML